MPAWAVRIGIAVANGLGLSDLAQALGGIVLAVVVLALLAVLLDLLYVGPKEWRHVEAIVVAGVQSAGTPTRSVGVCCSAGGACADRRHGRR